MVSEKEIEMASECTTPEVEREKEVNAEMKYLDESVANFSQTVERLAPSLSAVLSDAPPLVDDSEKAIKTLCALANEIRSVRFRIDSMEEDIRYMLKRIEVK